MLLPLLPVSASLPSLRLVNDASVEANHLVTSQLMKAQGTEEFLLCLQPLSVVRPLSIISLSGVQLAAAAHDTTGGMATKIEEAAEIAAKGIPVYIAKVRPVQTGRYDARSGFSQRWQTKSSPHNPYRNFRAVFECRSSSSHSHKVAFFECSKVRTLEQTEKICESSLDSCQYFGHN